MITRYSEHWLADNNKGIDTHLKLFLPSWKGILDVLRASLLVFYQETSLNAGPYGHWLIDLSRNKLITQCLLFICFSCCKLGGYFLFYNLYLYITLNIGEQERYFLCVAPPIPLCLCSCDTCYCLIIPDMFCDTS